MLTETQALRVFAQLASGGDGIGADKILADPAQTFPPEGRHIGPANRLGADTACLRHQRGAQTDLEMLRPGLPFAEMREGCCEAGKKIRSIVKTRVQLDFLPRAMSLLSELKEKTEAASYAEVVRNELKLYDCLISEVENGATIPVRGANGEISPFKIFL